MSFNKSQLALLKSYSGFEFLGLDASDPAGVDAAVRSRSTHDTLFDFLWIELADVGDDDAERALNKAIRQIEEVIEAL